MIRPIEKIYGATSRSKLTITPKQVTMRIRVGASDEERERTEKFFATIAEKVVEVPKTIRGNLAKHEPSDTLYIVMKNEAGDFSERFFETEIKPKQAA